MHSYHTGLQCELINIHCKFLGWYLKYKKYAHTRDFVHIVMSLALLPPELIARACYSCWKKMPAPDQQINSVNMTENYTVYRRSIRTNNDLEG